MNHIILDCIALDDCKLYLRFEGNEHREFDLESLIENTCSFSGLYTPSSIANPEYYTTYKVMFEETYIYWPYNSKDSTFKLYKLSADLLYENSAPLSHGTINHISRFFPNTAKSLR